LLSHTHLCVLIADRAIERVGRAFLIRRCKHEHGMVDKRVLCSLFDTIDGLLHLVNEVLAVLAIIFVGHSYPFDFVAKLV